MPLNSVGELKSISGPLPRVTVQPGHSGIRPPLKSEKDVRAATAKGAPFLPLIYQQNFHAPMDAALPQLILKLKHDVQTGEKTAEEATTRLEQFYAPIYQHSPKVASVNAGPQLKRFLAVVSNLFRSFTDRDKRASAGIDLVTTTPPLAFFQAASEQGVRRAKAALSSGCKSHPATAPAGSNRSSHGGNEVAEAFD